MYGVTHLDERFTGLAAVLPHGAKCRAGEASGRYVVEAAVEAVEYGNARSQLLPVKLVVRDSSRRA